MENQLLAAQQTIVVLTAQLWIADEKLTTVEDLVGEVRAKMHTQGLVTHLIVKQQLKSKPHVSPGDCCWKCRSRADTTLGIKPSGRCTKPPPQFPWSIIFVTLGLSPFPLSLYLSSLPLDTLVPYASVISLLCLTRLATAMATLDSYIKLCCIYSNMIICSHYFVHIVNCAPSDVNNHAANSPPCMFLSFHPNSSWCITSSLTAQ